MRRHVGRCPDKCLLGNNSWGFKMRREKLGHLSGRNLQLGQERCSRPVTKEMWDKALSLLNEIWDQINDCDKDHMPPLNYKHLEVVRGYMCHMAMTYHIISPFLKRFHLTLCKYFPMRDQQGWKIPDQAYMAYVHKLSHEEKISERDVAKLMQPQRYEDIEISKRMCGSYETCSVGRFHWRCW